MYWYFFGGLIIGFFLGFFLACILAAGSRDDEDELARRDREIEEIKKQEHKRGYQDCLKKFRGVK